MEGFNMFGISKIGISKKMESVKSFATVAATIVYGGYFAMKVEAKEIFSKIRNFESAMRHGTIKYGIKKPFYYTVALPFYYTVAVPFHYTISVPFHYTVLDPLMKHVFGLLPLSVKENDRTE